MSSVFHTSFKIYESVGCWLPANYPARRRRLYYCGTVLYLCAIFSFLTIQLLDTILVQHSLQSFISCCPFIFSAINGCGKSVNIVLKKNEIKQVIVMLDSELCKPRDATEKKIREQADKKCRLITKLCILLALAVIAFVIIGTLVTGVVPIHTRFLPRPLESKETFWPFVATLGTICSAMASVMAASSALTAGLMIQMCAQLDLLKHRLSAKLMKKNERADILRTDHIKLCIRHHLFIFEICECIQSAITIMLTVQMAITIGNFATSMFQIMLAEVKSFEFLSVVVYLVHSFEEVWLFFWYPNEVMEKSVDVRNGMYWTNWMDFRQTPKLEILNIMQRSDRPIVFWAFFNVPMTIASFTSILYTSFQAFTLFRTVALT